MKRSSAIIIALGKKLFRRGLLLMSATSAAFLFASADISAQADAKPGMEAEGAALAKARKDALLELIKSDPKKALSYAVAADTHGALPGVILALLEEPVSGKGAVALVAGERDKDGKVQRMPFTAFAHEDALHVTKAAKALKVAPPSIPRSKEAGDCQRFLIARNSERKSSTSRFARCI